MNRNFKGIWIPDQLFKEIGTLSLKLVSFVIFENEPNLHQLTRDDCEKLINKSICEFYVLSQEEVIEILKNKIPQKLDIPLSLDQCSWCKCLTAELHSHHYPIPKAKGGKKTIEICPNCHCEFHRLTGRGFFRVTKFYREMIETCQNQGDQNE